MTDGKILDGVLEDNTEDVLADLLNDSSDNTENKEDVISNMKEVPRPRSITPPKAKEPAIPVVSATEMEESIQKAEEREKLSPLERQKRDKAAGKLQQGLILSNEELLAGMEQKDKVIGVYNDDRLNSWDEAIAEMDDEINKRQYVTVVRAPQNQFEYMVMMDELNSLTFVDGKPVLDFRDKDGNPINLHFLRVREEGEPEFDFSELKSFDSTEKKDPNAPVQEVPTAVLTADQPGTVADTTDNQPAELDENGRKTVTILIDKTGFGANFDFDEAEMQKITTADEIRVHEVSGLQLKAITARKSERSFKDIKALKYDSGASTAVTICFPASGFKAKMKPLTYGEYTDLILAMDSLSFDNYRKELTIIYNKMTDISIGAFADFDDFLQHFASADLTLAIYGMYVATEPEESSMELLCQNPSCKKTFPKIYNPRQLLRLERCPQEFLDGMERVATADPMEYLNLHEKSAIMTSKLVEMPESHYIIELGISSAYHILYNYLPISTEESLKEAFGEDEFGAHFLNLNLLTGVRKIWVPDPDSNPDEPSYVECSTYQDLMPALYELSPRETQILRTYVEDIDSIYIPSVGLVTTRCPHCNTLSEFIPIALDDLVFTTYRRLINTRYSLDGSLRK